MTSAAPSEPHFLALPRRADVVVLARSWFAEAAWVREPGRAPSREAAVGARFRGIVDDRRAEPGALRLTWAASLEGPLDPAALAALGVGPAPSTSPVVFRLHVEPSAPPDARLLGWLRAAARRVGGAVLHGATVQRGDPETAVDLAVFSAVPVPPEGALGLVRSVVPGSHVTSAPEPEEGIAPYSLALPTQFDGVVELRFARAAELPVSLLQLDWREYGPFAYRIGWSPPAELGEAPDAQLVRIARARVRPLVARSAVVVARSAGGVVVDADGFVLSLDEAMARALAF